MGVKANAREQFVHRSGLSGADASNGWTNDANKWEIKNQDDDAGVTRLKECKLMIAGNKEIYF